MTAVRMSNQGQAESLCNAAFALYTADRRAKSHDSVLWQVGKPAYYSDDAQNIADKSIEVAAKILSAPANASSAVVRDLQTITDNKDFFKDTYDGISDLATIGVVSGALFAAPGLIFSVPALEWIGGLILGATLAGAVLCGLAVMGYGIYLALAHRDPNVLRAGAEDQLDKDLPLLMTQADRASSQVAPGDTVAATRPAPPSPSSANRNPATGPR